MKRRFFTIALALIIALSGISTTYAGTSDKELAQQIANENGATVEKVITISQGGKAGKVKGTNYRVKYPKKVKKGKKITCYMVVKNEDIIAMVCLHKVK